MIKEVIISGIILIALDAAFISLNYKAYTDQIVNIQRVVMSVKPEGAILAYCFLIGGLYYFILRRHRPVEEAFIFGMVIYGLYDFTNYALLKKWSLPLAIMDTIWGGVLMSLTTYATYQITRYR
jgi:uncharacterized membrane protein